MERMKRLALFLLVVASMLMACAIVPFRLAWQISGGMTKGVDQAIDRDLKAKGAKADG